MEPSRAVRPPGLRVISVTEQLRGVALPVLERTARRCSKGDLTHRGLVHLGAHFAAHALKVCVPPSAHAPWNEALLTADAWAKERVPLQAVAKARSDAYAATIQVERVTLAAVTAALARLRSPQSTLIDEHADTVVKRYAVLAANYAAGAALLVLDGVMEPAQLAVVPQQAAGALAYQSAGLGPARSHEVRAAACAQGDWEAGREGCAPEHGVGALAIQLFHEYLGGHWKDTSDGQRAFFNEFINWALLTSN